MSRFEKNRPNHLRGKRGKDKCFICRLYFDTDECKKVGLASAFVKHDDPYQYYESYLPKHKDGFIVLVCGTCADKSRPATVEELSEMKIKIPDSISIS